MHGLAHNNTITHVTIEQYINSQLPLVYSLTHSVKSVTQSTLNSEAFAKDCIYLEFATNTDQCQLLATTGILFSS